MMGLSRLADYAVVLMVECARHEGKTLSASMLSKMTGITPATTSKVLKLLLKAGILTSAQGKKGGYQLSSPTHQISIAEIIAAVDGPIGLTLCTLAGNACVLEPHCTAKTGFKQINSIILRELKKVTLAEIAYPLSIESPARTSQHRHCEEAEPTRQSIVQQTQKEKWIAASAPPPRNDASGVY